MTRRILSAGTIGISRILLAAKLPAAAYTVLRTANRLNWGDARVLSAIVDVCKIRGDGNNADMYRAEALRHKMPKVFDDNSLADVLGVMGGMERIGRAAQFQAGQMIARRLVNEAGREKIFEAARIAYQDFPDSAFLLHLITLCMSKTGRYSEASKMLVSQLQTPFDATPQISKRRFKLLQHSWRIVDLTAREQMDWVDGGGDYNSLLAPKSPDQIAKIDAFGSFKEHALQGRMRKEYLEICDQELAAASSLKARLHAIEEMMRPGIRHIPDYTQSYDMARDRLARLTADLDRLLTPEASKSSEIATQTVQDICTWLNLSRRLNDTATSQRLMDHLEALSLDETLGQALWPAPATLLKAPQDTEQGNRIMQRIQHLRPEINRQVQDYFRWAMLAQRYEEADGFYKNLPKNLHRKHGLLYYVNILQRQARFAEALRLLTDIHGQILANPSLVNAVSNNSLIKRTGELEFLIETAEIYQSVPQPTQPKGLVMIAARNVDQLRRYPLLALVEFKRRGWAVIPMVGGLLPRELTGQPGIDILNGALTLSLRFTEQAQGAFPALIDFESDPAQGRLRWGDIDLGHSAWEDAAINRRSYTINYGCPELQKYLGQLFEWTGAMCRTFKQVHNLHLQTGLPVGSISLFNSRLPDSLFRFYCEKFGDPDRFFYLHGANGYQNYFSNFSTNLSERYVLRNMTRNPDSRSASFPLPENFNRYYTAQKQRLPEIMARFKNTTRIKRSTGEAKELMPDAIAASARIKAWRAKGGKVACAFGKVVCDSGVPFDGGPVHANMKDWINHCIRAVQGSDTLLLIKPHPHEMNNQIATFLIEYFEDLIEEPLGENVMILGHRWFDIHDMKGRVDLGLIYNGTTAIELGLLGIPCLLAGHFAPVDYPIGHKVAHSRAEFEACLRFEQETIVAPDIVERAAVWLDYMANEEFALPYGYHTRPVTNKVIFPPWWIKADMQAYRAGDDRAIVKLVDRALGECPEP
ncbi:hypothetical protein [Profundibacter sp.]